MMTPAILSLPSQSWVLAARPPFEPVLMAFLAGITLLVAFGLATRRRKHRTSLVVGALVLLVAALAMFFVSSPGRTAGWWARNRSSFVHAPHPEPPEPPEAPAVERYLAGVDQWRVRQAERFGGKVRDLSARVETRAARLRDRVAEARRSRAPGPPEWHGPHAPPEGHALPEAPEMVVVRETFHGDLLEIDQLVREMAAETGGRVAWNLLSAVVIAAFLGLGYIAFDSATRGQFTWQLRLFAVIAFASLWFAASALNRYW